MSEPPRSTTTSEKTGTVVGSIDPRIRWLIGICLGGGGVVLYSWYVGIDTIISRAGSVAPWALAILVVLVVCEGLADGVGVWASVRPLKGGITWAESAQFALAGDFFDIVSPAGAATSEPIMARFISVATETAYSEALGVRGVAKYAKAGGQVMFSGSVGFLLLRGDAGSAAVLTTLATALAAVVTIGLTLVLFGGALAELAVRVLSPIVRAITRFVPGTTSNDTTVRRDVTRFQRRVEEFRAYPGLVGLIVFGGLAEQCLVALALWSLFAGVGGAVALLPILVVVPLPQAASIVPIPASLGAYDLLLAGSLAATTGTSAVTAATVVLLFRTLTLLFGLAAGGLCASLLRGWRPSRASA